MSSSKRTIVIGNGAGFLGDCVDAPRLLVELARLDYLTLEYLAELTLSILARQREKNPELGYAGDLNDVLGSLTPSLARQPGLRIVTNGGGMNPPACARAAARVLVAAGLGDVAIGVVTGDDLLGRIASLQAAGCAFTNLDTGRPLDALVADVISANAYLGAGPIADALAGGARVVVTGRVADASLTVGPAMHEFGWAWNDWDRLAGASVAGHLIECGAQATGGYSNAHDWRRLHLADVGYPIAELSDDATCVLTKPAGTGGVVNRRTVAEQLVYEIGDPRHYLTPDVDVDFTTVEIEDLGGQDAPDRVAVRGATGRPAPVDYKVSLAYHAGYTASAQLLVFGCDAAEKAQACAEIVRSRLRRAGYELEAVHVERFGAGDAVPGVFAIGSLAASAPGATAGQASSATEIMLRITVRDRRRDAVERFTKEIAPLATSGPAGLAGYATGRSPVRPVLAYWPTLVPKQFVQPQVAVRPAREWLSS